MNENDEIVNSLGDVLFRKFPIYSPMEWGERVKIDNYHVCGAPFGGPLALIKLDPPATAAVKENTIILYTSSGVKMAMIERIDNKKIAGSGWTDQEHFVIILEDGNLQLYDLHGKLLQNISIFEVVPSATLQILECNFWGNGVVCMASDMQVYVLEGLSVDLAQSPRKYKIKTCLTKDRPYTSIATIPPLLSRSGLLEVMIGTSDNSVVVVDEHSIEDQMLHDRINAPITKMAFSPNGRFLACYRRDGIMTVMSATFTTKVLDFDTKSASRPMDIAWCGEDAVVLLWKNTGIVMVGPYGDWLNFTYDGAIHLIADSDCCRIITSSSCDMLQRVPASTEAIRRIGSTDPAALMYDAMEAFEEGDPKSDDNIRSIAASNQLNAAVQHCITAAASEFDIKRQADLLKAASYGKAFCHDADSSEFVDTARKLRVLNNIRHPSIGLPLTIQQFNRLTPEVLVSRLTIRNHHLLALRICDILKIKTERVLIHWASEKVKRMALTSATDEEISKVIKKQLEPYGRVSYLEVAAAANYVGRRRLATMILDLEQNAADQVPLLLNMGEDELALQKAINSEDTDLIYLALIHLERSYVSGIKEVKPGSGAPNMNSFYRLIYSHPEAANLLKVYYRNKISRDDRSVLNDLLMFNKNYLEAGVTCINQAYMKPSIEEKIQLFKEASVLFQQGRDLSFYKTVTDEQIELIDIQRTLEIRSRRDFVDLSLSETIYNIILLGIEFPSDFATWDREITKIIKKFKVNEKTLYHIRVGCYGKTNSWALLSKLANEKKSPIGYKPFAQACIKYKQSVSETEKYIEKITAQEDRYELFMEVGVYRKAFEAAKQIRDPLYSHRLNEIMRLCKDPVLERQIQELAK